MTKLLVQDRASHGPRYVVENGVMFVRCSSGLRYWLEPVSGLYSFIKQFKVARCSMGVLYWDRVHGVWFVMSYVPVFLAQGWFTDWEIIADFREVKTPVIVRWETDFLI